MPVWLIPMTYTGGAMVCGYLLPRLEASYLPPHTLGVSVASAAQAFLSAVASGMMGLTGIVFALAFVLIQFSSVAYSPRLVNWFAADRVISTRLAFSSLPSSILSPLSSGWIGKDPAMCRSFPAS